MGILVRPFDGSRQVRFRLCMRAISWTYSRGAKEILRGRDVSFRGVRSPSMRSRDEQDDLPE